MKAIQNASRIKHLDAEACAFFPDLPQDFALPDAFVLPCEDLFQTSGSSPPRA
jgi:hypothetical protein